MGQGTAGEHRKETQIEQIRELQRIHPIPMKIHTEDTQRRYTMNFDHNEKESQ
jgi:hypothetical protein